MKRNPLQSPRTASYLAAILAAFFTSTPLLAQQTGRLPVPAHQPDVQTESLPAPQKTKNTQADGNESMPAYDSSANSEIPSSAGSTYIPVDSWIYPEMLRLYSMGYVDTTVLGMRPWTRLSVLRMLRASQQDILGDGKPEAIAIYNAILAEIQPDLKTAGGWAPHAILDATYERVTGIAGTPLNDSYHLGQTIINDYGRPYEQGFNDYTGFSGRGNMGRFTLYVRGEYQHAPSATGYSAALAQTLSNNDGIPYVPQSTIPAGPIAAQNYFRLIEANLSYQFWNHEFSIGKSDVWDGPALGGAFDWSNNAQNIYSFRINRVEPLHIPILSFFIGPVRYEFLVGSLKGHTDPNSPWVHMEKFEFKPTGNF